MSAADLTAHVDLELSEADAAAVLKVVEERLFELDAGAELRAPGEFRALSHLCDELRGDHHAEGDRLALVGELRGIDHRSHLPTGGAS